MNTVILDKLKEEDKQILFQWINNKELVELNSFFKETTWENHCKWFEQITNRNDVRIFAIRLTTDNSIIGTCQLLNINTLVKSAELQIRIGDFSKMGKGFGSEAVKQLLKFGFNELKLQRIYLHVFTDNIRAYKSYLKNGFKTEGTLRRAAFIGNNFKDMYLMSILAEEFNA